MNAPPLLNAVSQRVVFERPPVASRILSGLMVLCTGLATPFVGIIALTMTFIFFGVTHSSTMQYTAGAGGVVMYGCFVATPVVCVLHLVAAAGGISLRVMRWVWLVTCLYMLGCWMAMMFGAEGGGGNDAGEQQGSWVPLIVLLLLASSVSVAGAVLTLVYRFDDRRLPPCPPGMRD